MRIITVEQLCKELLPSCQLQFSSLYICAYKLVEIITSIVFANSSNLPDFCGPTQNLSENMPRSTRLVAMPARATSQNQLLYAPHNIPPIPETSSRSNMPYLTTPAVTPARAASWDQLPYALQDVFPTLKTSFSPNTPYPITPAVIPIRTVPRDQLL